MDSMQVFRQLRPVSFEEFVDRFSKIESSVFRLEMLDLYSVESELEAYKEYLNGRKTPPEDFNAGWVDLIKKSVSKGIDFRRVRLKREPLHSYVEFEIAWAYKVNIEAGDNVGIVQCDNVPEFDTKVPILKDFWMFDDQECYLMEYDLLGQFLGINKLPQEFLELYVKLKYEVIRKSQDITESELWKKLVF